MTPVCEGAGSHFALKQSLVIFVLWLGALVISCETIGQDSCMLAVSHPLETLHRSAFSNVSATCIWSRDAPLGVSK